MFQNWAPFLPWRNGHFWKEIGQKLFKIGLHVLGLKNGHFWKEIGQKLAKNWPKIVQNWAPFLPWRNGHFSGINWPKIDPENFKIRRRSDSTFGLAQLAHNMAKTGCSSRKWAWISLHETQFNSKGWNSRLQRWVRKGEELSKAGNFLIGPQFLDLEPCSILIGCLINWKKLHFRFQLFCLNFHSKFTFCLEPCEFLEKNNSIS